MDEHDIWSRLDALEQSRPRHALAIWLLLMGLASLAIWTLPTG